MFNRILAWFDNRYSPVALAADRQPPMGLWPFVFYFVGQFRSAFLIRIVLVAIGSVADATLPIFVGVVVGLLATTAPGEMFSQHWPTLLGMIVVVAVIRPLTFILDSLVRNHAIQPNLVNLVRWQSHFHVIRQSWTFFQNDFAGRISNKVLQSGEALETAINSAVDAVWYAIIFVVVAIVVLAQMDVVLLLPMVVWLALYGLLFTIVMPLISRFSEKLSEAKSVMTGRMVDSYTNIQTLKTFSSDDHEDRYVSEAVLEHTDEYRRLMAVFTYMWSVLFILNAGLVVSITWLALAGWNNGALTAASVATAIPFALQIMNMSGWILEIGSNIFRQFGTARDSMETIAQPLTLLNAPGAVGLEVTKGELVFDDVSFNYWRGKSGTVIEHFNLTIAPGEKVGLVGRSGAGKSTLVNLALRLFDVEDGAIRIDGQDVREVTQESVRAAIGLVSQDTSLLHRSVRENIKYGRQSATDEAMVEAADQAKIGDVIAGLADPQGRRGYDAHVGERGVKLSGGQRQRVAIARVLLKNAPILILDEATSALDSEVEAAIQEQLQSLMRGKTVIAIAHRLSTIAAMDRLVVLEAGQIVEEGTHAELLARGGHYAQLWERQSGGFLDLDAKAAE
ncbi:MAG: ABC transporter ATP-binding protein [Devosia nanyangense]|uniref:ABC transporter ATP-binding protein n=1 Tax=Devosia nanyangense TaxID=1228055 RepID=A0A933L2S0_9HYPH|nr:ABC transporter ATP-binding protein [Devosia nanyangense]